MKPELLAEVTRGDWVESRHHGWVVVVDRAGQVIEQIGDDEAIFPRSAAKPFQAMPLISSGAAKRLMLSSRELALICGSHSGRDEHRAIAMGLLIKAGQTPEALHCGAQYPLDEALADEMKARHEQPTALHHNCSGKHAGMLCLCRDQSWDPRSYEGAEHPVQQAIRLAFAEAAGLRPERLEAGVDGCSVPAWRLPLAGLARAFATLGREARWESLVDAMARHPELVAGPGRFDTELMRAAGHLVAKSGAEAVHAGVDRRSGLAWALKVADGTRRAVSPVVIALLRRHGLLSDEEVQALAPWARTTLRNFRGLEVGLVRPV